MNHLQRSRVATILAAALDTGDLYVQPGKTELELGYRCTACLRMDNHAPTCRPPRGVVKSETNASDMCRWCRHQEAGGPRTGPYVVDENGVDIAVSKLRVDLRWAHCWDDGWWDCDAAVLFPTPGDIAMALDEHRKRTGWVPPAVESIK